MLFPVYMESDVMVATASFFAIMLYSLDTDIGVNHLLFVVQCTWFSLGKLLLGDLQESSSLMCQGRW